MLAVNQLQNMLHVAVTAAHQAGKHALSQMNQAQATIKEGTTGQELVTQADKECQDLIIETLRKSFPQDGFLGEEGEGGITQVAPQSRPGVTWVIDPIDGTNNYAHHIELFAICVAAMVGGRPVVGVIYAPVTDTTYAATERSPATCNGRTVQCNQESLSPFACVAIDSHIGGTCPAWIGDLMMKCRFRNLGTTALHLALTATGGFAASVQITPKLWDIAAGALIAERAGAKVSTWEDKPLWPMDVDSYQGGPLPCLVGNATAHQAILEALSHG